MENQSNPCGPLFVTSKHAISMKKYGDIKKDLRKTYEKSRSW